MAVLICGFILIAISLVLFYKSQHIKIAKETYNNTLYEQLLQLIQKKEELTTTLDDLAQRKNTLNQEILQQKQDKENEMAEWRASRQVEMQQYLATQQENIHNKILASEKNAQARMIAIDEQVQTARDNATQQKQILLKQIDELRATLSAGVEARIREQQQQDKLEFYKLSLTQTDLSDVKKLQSLQLELHEPVVLSKLIWTQYFQKQMTELCYRVLGDSSPKCGIYKITNLITQQCYIGQSVNIADRWKQHCKCGLGIDASATNLLYNSMQKYGVWNFTFELLEECPRASLNEKQAFWIDVYSSNKFGFNQTKGNMK